MQADETRYQQADALEFARARSLLVSGGSDFHGASHPQVRMGTGIGGALFFTAFQPVTKLFFKEEHALDAMVRNSALYTFSWSTGLALGPFIAAFVWGLFDAATGWRSCYLIAIGFQLLVGYCLALVCFRLGVLFRAGASFGLGQAAAVIVVLLALFTIFRPAPKAFSKEVQK